MQIWVCYKCRMGKTWDCSNPVNCGQEIEKKVKKSQKIKFGGITAKDVKNAREAIKAFMSK